MTWISRDIVISGLKFFKDPKNGPSLDYPNQINCPTPHYRVAVRERFDDVEKSLHGHHDHGVEAAGERHLGEREDEGDEARLDLLAVLRGETGESVEQQHSNLITILHQSPVTLVIQ